MPDGARDELLDILSRNAQAARLRLGLSVEDMAERAGLDVLTLDAVERGDGHRLTMLGLARLASALGVPASRLLEPADRREAGRA